MKYKWNKKEIITDYAKCIKNIIKYKNYDFLYDIDYLKDMIFQIFKLPEFYPEILKKINFKRDLLCDYDFTFYDLTNFQRNMLDNIINNTLEENFSLFGITNPSDNNFDYILYLERFSKEISPILYYELKNTIDNKKLYVDESKRNLNFCGTCYSLTNKNYYQIVKDNSNNMFSTLSHELIHGIVNNLSNRKFDKDKKVVLYREVGSILIELYANLYLFNKKLEDKEEYIYNFNRIYLSNIYSDIEIIDFLYRLSKININKNTKNIKDLINKEKDKNPNYDFELYELTDIPLKNYLIYLYSASIALSIYQKYKDNFKEGMEVSLDIVLNITDENEKELLEKYDLDIIEALNIYKKENNSLVKSI